MLMISPPPYLTREANANGQIRRACLKMDGTENAYVIHKELGEWMTNNMTVVRYNEKLEETIDKIKELKAALQQYQHDDTARWNNPGRCVHSSAVEHA